MKKLLLSLFLLLGTLSYGQILVRYDYMETFNWVGIWNTATNTGWYTNASVSSNQSAVIIGGGNSSSPIEDNWYRLPNITGLDASKQYQFRFRLASYSFSNPTAATKGVDGPDYVSVQVSRNGATYVNELRITGNANATWPYNTTGNITHTANGVFSTINAPTGDVYQSGAGVLTNGPSVISLNIPINTTQLAVDLYCRVNSAGEEWWIDNIELWDVTPIALPVELVSFNGKKYNNSNLLYWTIASENNNNFFTIERSIDGTNWEIVETITSYGNHQTETNYTHIDKSFENGLINYYRLSQTDFDGVTKIFNTISIDNMYTEKKINKIINIRGEELDEIIIPGIYYIIYDDGTRERVIR